MIELRDGTRIFGSHWQRMSVFLFPHVLTLFIYSMCRTDKGYLIHPCIHLYVKSDGFFFVTSIWGLLEVNIAELRVTENHLKKKKNRWGNHFHPEQPAESMPRIPLPPPANISLSFIRVSPESENTWPMPRKDVLYVSLNYFQLNEYFSNLCLVPGRVKKM